MIRTLLYVIIIRCVSLFCNENHDFSQSFCLGIGCSKPIRVMEPRWCLYFFNMFATIAFVATTTTITTTATITITITTTKTASWHLEFSVAISNYKSYQFGPPSAFRTPPPIACRRLLLNSLRPTTFWAPGRPSFSARQNQIAERTTAKSADTNVAPPTGLFCSS